MTWWFQTFTSYPANQLRLVPNFGAINSQTSLKLKDIFVWSPPFNMYAGTSYIYDRNFWNEWSPILTFEVVFPQNHLVWQCFLQESLLNRKPTYYQELFDLVIYYCLLYLYLPHVPHNSVLSRMPCTSCQNRLIGGLGFSEKILLERCQVPGFSGCTNSLEMLA